MLPESKWIKLKSIPKAFRESTLLIRMNVHQYIIISSEISDSTYVIYDISKNEFNDPIKILGGEYLEVGDWIRCAYNDNHPGLFIYNEYKGVLGVIDTKTNKFKVVLDDIHLLGYNARILSLHDSIHIIDREDPNHYIFNVKSSELIHHSQDHTEVNWVDQAIILKSEQSILALDDDKIYKYSINDKKWTESCKRTGLKRYSHAASVITKDERYIIFFAKDNVYSTIFDRKQQNVIQSKIKCPIQKGAEFQAILIYDDHRDELLTAGFINQCFNSSEFQSIRKLPQYLMKHIGTWISIEYIHLIFHDMTLSDYVQENHWKINVDDILTSIVDSNNNH